MATKFPILPHYPINADVRACLSALAFVFICLYVLCWNAKHFVMSLFWKKQCVNRFEGKCTVYPRAAKDFKVSLRVTENQWMVLISVLSRYFIKPKSLEDMSFSLSAEMHMVLVCAEMSANQI